ncbi:MAG: efflux RND transporter periplasmic adaptor subunit [Hydrogenovibrio sp.]|nr:efflux RND transporter periplasmic adaptor subunit [Hydrogenovibrio sp.]
MKKIVLHVFMLGALGLGAASVASAQTVKIGSLVAGQVTEVAVKAGQTVKAGQLLMKIDDARFQAKLKSAAAKVEMARLKLADAKIELDQALDLFDRTVSAKRELDAAQLAHDLAQQSYDMAKADLAYYQAWARYYVIKAPVSGRVRMIDAPKGTTVYKENTPLIQLEY